MSIHLVSFRILKFRRGLGLDRAPCSACGLGAVMAVAGAVLGGIDLALVGGAQLARSVEHAEEARLESLVTGGAVAALIDREQNGVGVAIIRMRPL
jgi:hypothetical protein